MRHIVRSSLLLSLLACGLDGLPPEPEFEPVLVDSSEVILWQGVDHSWIYNHRWGRLGSGFVHFDPDQVADAWPLNDGPLTDLPTSPTWTYMGSAGAGTGIDFGDHRASGLRLSDAQGSVHFASTTAHTRIGGAEGVALDEVVALRLPLPEGMAADLSSGGTVAVLLNGFWLQSVGDEAKKPQRFELDVDVPTVTDGRLEVDVNASLTADCDTPECQGCTAKPFAKVSEDLAYDLWVDLLVVSGASGDFASDRHLGDTLEFDWDGPSAKEGSEACLKETNREECWDYWVDCGDSRLRDHDELPDEAGRTSIQLAVPDDLAVGLIGLSGLSLELDDPHHMIALELGPGEVTQDGATLTAEPVLRFQNWRHDMNLTGQDADPRSATAYGTSGTAVSRLDLVALGFSGLTVEPVRVEETILTEADQQLLVEM